MEIELLRILLKALLEYSENFEMTSDAEKREKQNQLYDLTKFMISGRK